MNYASRHEVVCGSGGIAPSFLTFALDVCECLASSPYSFTRCETDPNTRRKGSLGLDITEKRKISCSYRDVVMKERYFLHFVMYRTPEVHLAHVAGTDQTVNSFI
jgi:hypothetical protein